VQLRDRSATRISASSASTSASARLSNNPRSGERLRDTSRKEPKRQGDSPEVSEGPKEPGEPGEPVPVLLVGDKCPTLNELEGTEPLSDLGESSGFIVFQTWFVWLWATTCYRIAFSSGQHPIFPVLTIFFRCSCHAAVCTFTEPVATADSRPHDIPELPSSAQTGLEKFHATGSCTA